MALRMVNPAEPSRAEPQMNVVDVVRLLCVSSPMMCFVYVHVHS